MSDQLPCRLAALLCALLLSACSAAPRHDLLLRNVRLVAVEGLSVPDGPVDVALADGHIRAVEPAGSVAPEAAEVLDLSGRFLLPGFVDLHVHLPPDRAVQDAVLDQLLRYGVTTILNPGAREGAGVRLRERRGERPPRLLTAGPIIEWRASTEAVVDWAVLVDDEATLRAEVRRQAALGVDWVKLYARLPPELVAAGITEAHGLGLPVVVHAGATTWRQAAAAGADMLVHSGYGTPMDELVHLPDPAAASDADWYAGYADAPNGPAFAELVDELVRRGVVVVPTLAITQAGGLGRDASLLPLFETHLAPEADLPGWWSEGWRERHPQYGPVSAGEAELLETVYWPGVLGIVRALHEAGVTLGVGTDVGNAWITPGASFHRELELLVEAGLAPATVLRLATVHGAEALGLGDELGAVAVGCRADLVVLAADPTDDIRNTRRVELVLVDGRVVARP